ncbi:flavodoxin [Tissierella creatinini]|nr:flavodoxin [Tissierella creatinini]TJX60684.1 flavodoxin [Soehngenia saccharolytica]
MSKKLVAYFSATGTTRKVAQALSEAINADLYEIKPEVPYIKIDLDWTDNLSRSTIEMKKRTFRPMIADKDANVKEYDIIFLGFPIWWYIAPTIINTFLETYDFGGKTIVLFATSGGSGFGRTAINLKRSLGDTTTIIEGKILDSTETKDSLKSWVDSLGTL